MQGLKTGCCHPGAIHTQVHVNFLFSTYKTPSSFHFGFMSQKPKCFPVSLGVLEFSGDPNAKVKIDLPQRLAVQEEMSLWVLTCICMNLGSWVTKSFLPSVTSEKSRGERDILYKQSQRIRQRTDLIKTGVRRLCIHEHSGSHLSILPNAVNPSRDEMALISTNVSMHGFVVTV